MIGAVGPVPVGVGRALADEFCRAPNLSASADDAGVSIPVMGGGTLALEGGWVEHPGRQALRRGVAVGSVPVTALGALALVVLGTPNLTRRASDAGLSGPVLP